MHLTAPDLQWQERDQCLNANQFLSIEDARRKIESWWTDYNFRRPDGATTGTTARVRRTAVPLASRRVINESGQAAPLMAVGFGDMRAATLQSARARR